MDQARRKFVRKLGYAAPAIMTMTAMPAIANTGSGAREPAGDNPDAEGATVRWQSRARRRFVRRMKRRGAEINQFGFDDWSRVDPETWTLKD